MVAIYQRKQTLKLKSIKTYYFFVREASKTLSPPP